MGGAWGAVLAGNLSGVVREQTRCQHGAGNASLAFDNALGELGDWGGGYVGCFGPCLSGSVVTLAAEGPLSRTSGNDEISLTLGTQYDVARGLSANLGLNHARSQAIVDDARLTDTDETSAIFS